MSTQHEYDPEKANAWTRDFATLKPTDQESLLRLFAYVNRKPNHFDALESAARAVIAAGRPHVIGHISFQPCDCPKCEAYDALAQLLKDTP